MNDRIAYSVSFKRPKTKLRVLKRRIQRAWRRGLIAVKRLRDRGVQ